MRDAVTASAQGAMVILFLGAMAAAQSIWGVDNRVRRARPDPAAQANLMAVASVSTAIARIVPPHAIRMTLIPEASRPLEEPPSARQRRAEPAEGPGTFADSAFTRMRESGIIFE